MTELMKEVPALLPVLVDATLKGSALLLLVFAGARVMRRAPAATRHQVWSAGLLAVVMLPLLSLSVPWRLEVLPSLVQEVRASSSAAAAVPVPGPSIDVGAAVLPPGEVGPASASSSSEAAAREPVPAGAGGLELDVAALLAMVWAAGALLALLRLVVGWVAAWLIVRRAEPLTADAWAGDLLRLTERLGLGRPVRLLRSERVRLAFTTGLLRPVVVLPPDCRDWSPERRRAVLLHELAHVRRGDLLMHLISRAACAIHWFNPLVWLAARRLRAESERACDDMVIRLGTKASDYAGHLLDMVRAAGRLRAPAVVLPMAQESEFEGRLLAILEPDVRRQAPSRVATAGIGLAIALSALPLAAIAPAAAAPDPPDSPDTADAPATLVDTAPTDAAQEPEPATSDEPAPATTEEPAPTSPEPPTVWEEGYGSPEGTDPPQDARGAVLAGLVAALDDPDSEVRNAAAHALGEMQDTAAVLALMRALTEDRDAEVRATAAYSLGQLESRRAVPALGQALSRDPAAEVRNRAAWALGQIEDATAVDALVAGLGDDDAEVRNRVAWALGQIESPAAVPGLVGALRDPVPGVRERAAWALGQIESPDAIDGLMGALGDESADVRRYVLWALYQIEDPRARPAFERALADPDPRVRVYAVRGIGDLELSQAPQALLDAASDENAEVRKYVAWALGEIEDPAAVPALSRLLRDPEPEIRRYALRGLAEIGDDSAIQALVEALQDEDAAVRREAARALGRLGGGDADGAVWRLIEGPALGSPGHVRVNIF